MEKNKRGRPVGSVDIEVQDRILNTEIEKINELLGKAPVSRTMASLVNAAHLVRRIEKHLVKASRARQLLTENS